MDDKNSNIKSQMRKGMLEYCILLVLEDDRKYTSDIIDRMQRSGLTVVEGTLYTLLNRLRKEGKLTYDWEESPKGPPRKYYRLTPAGKETLRYMSESWDEIVHTVDTLRRNRSENENREERVMEEISITKEINLEKNDEEDI